MIRHPLISRIAVCTGAMNFCGMLIFTMLPLLILRNLGLGPQGMGLIMAAGAVGGLLGAIAAPRLAEWAGEGTVIPVCASVSSVFLIPVPVAAMIAPARDFVGAAAPFRVRFRLRCPGLQHHAAQHAPTGVSAQAPGPDERVHPVRCVGSDAAGGACLRPPWRAPWAGAGDLDRHGGKLPGGRTGLVLAVCWACGNCPVRSRQADRKSVPPACGLRRAGAGGTSFAATTRSRGTTTSALRVRTVQSLARHSRRSPSASV